MFGIYFGKYLMEEGLITEEQYEELIEQTKNSRVQMGLLAVEMGLMTEEQTDEVNQLQQTQDKRFGDIAIEQGYLTEEDVADILDRQGDPYLLFIQALLERDLMTIDDIRDELVVYRKDKGLSIDDMEAIKTGNIDHITRAFINSRALLSQYKNYIMLTSRNIVRFVDRFFYMERMEEISSIDVENLALQHITGDYSFYTILCGEKESIHALTQAFARTSFDVYEEVPHSLDATKEFLHCNNGLFLTELKKVKIRINLELPVIKDTPTTISADTMYRIPYYISEHRLDLIICEEDNFRMEEK